MMLRDSVYEAIKGLLMDNDLAPGSRLSIDGLAREMQVSPTPVREAMTRLESDGLVAKRPHAGYIVAPLMDRVALDNLYEIRLLIEPQAARLAATRASAGQLAELRASTHGAAARPAGENYDGYRDFAIQDARLHRIIAEASGNPLIADALARLHAHTHSYRLYFRVGIAEEALHEHERVIASIEARDGEQAFAHMQQHLEASRERLRAVSDDQNE
jgi:DNA-binding GntR family transcriptional regulator